MVIPPDDSFGDARWVYEAAAPPNQGDEIEIVAVEPALDDVRTIPDSQHRARVTAVEGAVTSEPTIRVVLLGGS
jgi:hypothetical protein